MIDVYAAAGTPVTLTVAATSTTGKPTAVELWRRRDRLAAADVASGADATLAFTASGAWPDQVILESPYQTAPGPNGWPTRFGVDLVALTVGRSPPAGPGRPAAGKLLAPDRLGNLATYDTVVANSAFTARWVERLWGRHSEVLYPPVRMMAAGAAKEPIILSVGRFFDPARGHSKKQLELVEAFGQLHAAGGLPGWSYHVVGGCNKEDREYAMAVKRAALGLPVHVHVNAPGDVARRPARAGQPLLARRRPGRGSRAPSVQVRALRCQRGGGHVGRCGARRVRRRRTGRDRARRRRRPPLRHHRRAAAPSPPASWATTPSGPG